MMMQNDNDNTSESNSLTPKRPTKNPSSSSSSVSESSSRTKNNPQSVNGIHRLYISEMNSPILISEWNSPIYNNNISFEQVVVDRVITRLEIKEGKVDCYRFFDIMDEFNAVFKNKLFLKCLFEILVKYRSVTGPMAKKLLYKNGITKDKNTIRKYLNLFADMLGVCDRIKSNETDLNLPTLKPLDFVIYTVDNDFEKLLEYYGQKTEQKTDRYIRVLDSKSRKKDLVKKAKRRREIEDRIKRLQLQMGDNTLDRYLRQSQAKELDNLQAEMKKLEGLDD